MPGKEAFQKLWNYEPTTELEKIVKQYFLANLPDDITESKGEAIPQDSIFSKFFVKEKSDVLRNPQQTSENVSLFDKLGLEKQILNSNSLKVPDEKDGNLE